MANYTEYGMWLKHFKNIENVGCIFGFEDAMLILSVNQNSIAHLDLFLRTLDWYRMAGEVERALDLIRHFSVWLNPALREESEFQRLFTKSEPILSKVMKKLSVDDKYVFWITCFYYVVYLKVPDQLVEMIGRKQYFQPLQWPSTEISGTNYVELLFLMVDDAEKSAFSEPKGEGFGWFLTNLVEVFEFLYEEKHMDKEEKATRLISRLYQIGESCAHLVGYLYSVDECWTVLNQYIRRNYVGVQFIWNHIFNLLCDSGQSALLLDSMNKWWNSVWKVKNIKREKGACIDGCFTSTNNPVAVVSGPGNSSGTVKRNASDMYAIFSCCNAIDKLYGMINFSLYKKDEGDVDDGKAALHLAMLADNASVCVKSLVLYLREDMHIDAAAAIIRNLCLPVSKRNCKSLLLEDCTADSSSMRIYVDAWTEIVQLTHQISFDSDLVKHLQGWFDIPGNYLLPMCVCSVLRNGSDASEGAVFWALSNLMKALVDAVPEAAEYAFVEAANIVDEMLPSLKGKKRDSLHLQALHLHEKALSAYPFSRMMWQSYDKYTSKFPLLQKAVKIVHEKHF